ncbi:MAG: aldo/keto reductase [Oscillospiraceae bacterium]|nr:aldo/keto reductase [Oscillospiraceae bacterium]
MNYVTLANGVKMPQLGLGIMNIQTQEDMDICVKAALESGCRAFDCAYCYGNEKIFGNALKNSGEDRKNVFITTKSRTLRHSYQDAIDTVYSQLEAFQTNYFDLYLLHWPLPSQPPLYLEAWKALEKLYKDGILRAIGVSNFFVKQLDKVISQCEIKPMIDQIQIQPYYVNQEVIDYCGQNGIQMESWQPFGGGQLLRDEKICAIAEKHGKSPAQILLRWQMQKGFVALPGSVRPAEVQNSFDIFNFELAPEDMETILSLECGKPIMLPFLNGVYDPDTFPVLW